MEFGPAGQNGLHRAKSMRLNSNKRGDRWVSLPKNMQPRECMACLQGLREIAA